jgi:hypothetical protein
MQSNAHVTNGPTFNVSFGAKRADRLVLGSESRKSKSRPIARRNRREARRALRALALEGGGEFVSPVSKLTGWDIV